MRSGADRRVRELGVDEVIVPGFNVPVSRRRELLDEFRSEVGAPLR